jgi:prepilin peptidase CpaA
MPTFEPSLELLKQLLLNPRYSILFLLLLIASVSDCRSYRIPNWLTFGGTTFALLYSLVVPFAPKLGFGWALGGYALGLCFMLPLYVLGAMGAGDVKLMAMVGAFLGLSDVIYAVLFVFALGGVMAVAHALWHQSLARMFSNTRLALRTLWFSTRGGQPPDAPNTNRPSVGKLPYALSIFLGTATFMVASQLGYA